MQKMVGIFGNLEMDQNSKKWMKVKIMDENAEMDENPKMDKNPEMDENTKK